MFDGSKALLHDREAHEDGRCRPTYEDQMRTLVLLNQEMVDYLLFMIKFCDLLEDEVNKMGFIPPCVFHLIN